MLRCYVISLRKNVPDNEAIRICSYILYYGDYKLPPVIKKKFKKLLRIYTCDVLVLTHDSYHRQIECLAMGSPTSLE